MFDHEVRKHGPFLFRHQLHEVPLDLYRILLSGELEPVSDALDVCVYYYSFIDAERVSDHHVLSVVDRMTSRPITLA